MEYQTQDFKVQQEKDGSIEFSFLLEDKGPLPVASDKDVFTLTGSAIGFINGQLKIAGRVVMAAVVTAAPVVHTVPPPPPPPAPAPAHAPEPAKP